MARQNKNKIIRGSNNGSEINSLTKIKEMGLK